jgi:phage tail sheath protein FI
MAFQLSPGVLVVEKDLTNVVPAVATSIGGFVGEFQWGPVLEPVTISSEIELVKTFGKPNDTTAASFFSAANFLSYSNNLKVVRVVGTAARNAVSSGTAVAINNEEAWEASYASGQASVGEFAAKYPGALGNSLKVSMADSATFTGWAYEAQFDAAPSTSAYVSGLGGADDELHIIVVDEDGLISGTAGTILEKFANVSKAVDAKTSEGAANYYVEVLSGSRYIWWMDHTTSVEAGDTAWGSNAAGTTFKTMSTVVTRSLTGGVDASPSTGNVQTGYDEFANAELIDVNLLVMGPHGATVANDAIAIAEDRKDCMVFISPELADVYNNAGDEATDVVAFRSTLTSSSYAVLDSGWKYQYDKYADKYRWIPLNADIAGLCARTDTIADPWFSPGGLNRGQIRNVVKLAYSPDKTDRDTLYKKGVNPVVSFPGEGTVLYGDKTLQSKPSAFDRINVRRLFIVLEKAIATAAKYQLFEFNDAFTRAQFRNLVEPFLRDIKGRRGVYDFRVICDETNNTGEVIDQNQFVADIYIKPARSINFITLNFIATRTGVAFEEIVGA